MYIGGMTEEVADMSLLWTGEEGERMKKPYFGPRVTPSEHPLGCLCEECSSSYVPPPAPRVVAGPCKHHPGSMFRCMECLKESGEWNVRPVEVKR